MAKPFLCRLKLHWPLRGHKAYFIDVVSGKTVWAAYCDCGQKWMIDTLSPFPITAHKVKMVNYADDRSSNEDSYQTSLAWSPERDRGKRRRGDRRPS